MSGFQRILEMSGRSVAIGVLAGAVVTTAALPATATTAPRTKAQTRTVANHINLRQTDFPGYKAHPHQNTKGSRALAKEYTQCTGIAPKFSAVTSPAFDSGHGAVFYSLTRFVASRAAAQHDSALLDTAQARDCLKQELKEIASAVGASKADITLTPVSEASRNGLDAISGVQITVAWTAYGFHGTLHGWAINFSRGNAEVTLDQLGTTNLSQSDIEAPLGNLIARTKHKVPSGGVALQH